MSNEGLSYAMNLWQVKKGNEKNFIDTWNKFAEYSLKNHRVFEGTLLQENENSQKFVSYGRWEDDEAIKEWRGSPEFNKYFVRFKELCDDIQPKTLKQVSFIKK